MISLLSQLFFHLIIQQPSNLMEFSGYQFNIQKEKQHCDLETVLLLCSLWRNCRQPSALLSGDSVYRTVTPHSQSCGLSGGLTEPRII